MVFYGADAGDDTVSYIGGLGDKMGDLAMKTSFARSMSVPEAMDPANLLCYEMNGAPLPKGNGYPLRLIAPRWYGIANVKWLTRIEVRADPLPRHVHGHALRHGPRGAAAGRRQASGRATRSAARG